MIQENVGSKKSLEPNNFESKNFGHKKMLPKKIQEKKFNPKKFWYKKSLGPKEFCQRINIWFNIGVQYWVSILGSIFG